jgi:endonuclease/exonuclease/phosphatase family metal-dependent hydrolase
MTLRLASYNIHKCLGTDRRREPGRIIDVINAVGADVIALQEVDRRMGPRAAALPYDMVLKHTDFTPLPLAPNGPSLGWHGQTLLVRSDIEIGAFAKIDLPGLEPRGAVMAEIVHPAGAFRIVGVHLGLVRRYRRQQLAEIRSAVEARAAMPTAILGDFNEWSSRGGMEPLVGAYHVHAPGRSFHAARPVAALDRIALGHGLHLRNAGVEKSPLARLASDHLPIWADIRLEEQSDATDG